jgi:hypothetical protein
MSSEDGGVGITRSEARRSRPFAEAPRVTGFARLAVVAALALGVALLADGFACDFDFLADVAAGRRGEAGLAGARRTLAGGEAFLAPAVLRAAGGLAARLRVFVARRERSATLRFAILGSFLTLTVFR